jgi:hypothetical protein
MSDYLIKRKRKSKITKRKHNMTKRKEKKMSRRFKKSRKQYGGKSHFILEVDALLNNFDFSKSEKNDLMVILKDTEPRYNEFPNAVPNRKDTLFRQLNLAINSTDSTPDEKKIFVTKLIHFWLTH